VAVFEAESVVCQIDESKSCHFSDRLHICYLLCFRCGLAQFELCLWECRRFESRSWPTSSTSCVAVLASTRLAISIPVCRNACLSVVIVVIVAECAELCVLTAEIHVNQSATAVESVVCLSVLL